jgi:cell division protein FtsI (penicillin-binding protein 3)
VNAAFKRRRSRIGWLTLVLAGLFALVAVRLVALVMLDGPRLTSLARSEHTGEVALAAIRGPIVDRNGEPFALSAESRSVYARPHSLLEATTPKQRARLANALELSPVELERQLAKPAPFIWLARRIPRERAEAAEALGLEGIGSIAEYKRFYPESNLAAGVVGLAGVDGQGLSGLELQYDHLIKGEPIALSIYRDALGHQILDSPLSLKSVEPGARLELTLDSTIQALAESQLGQQVREAGAKRGSAIVLDPFTGEVLALANVSADPNETTGRLHDCALQDAFEPGSTAKGILGAIALEDRAIAATQRIYCENGEMTVGRRRIHDHSAHGWLDLGGIIEVSSNIGAAKIAMALGAQRYYRGLKGFGLGRRTGIDLPGEAAGMLGSPSRWGEIELANHGFGQGIAVTAMQLAVAYAAIANGGLVMRPYVVRAAYDAEGSRILSHTPQVLGRAVSPAVAHQMNVLLRSVVNGEDGTGRRAQVDDFIVAGKTGTAQMINPETGAYYQSRLVASFVGFVPADDPRLVILVVLEDVSHGHFGGVYAAPVFSAIASGALGQLNVASTRGPEIETASMLPIPSGADAADVIEHDAAFERATAIEPLGANATAPDFTGLSLREAFALAHRMTLNLEVSGTGYVVSQDPARGELIQRSSVRLELSRLVEGSSRPSSKRVAAASNQRRHGQRIRR